MLERFEQGYAARPELNVDFKAEVERVNEHLRENYLKND